MKKKVPPREPSDDILTMHELAAYLKLNEKTAYRLAAQGEIPGFKVGGSWRFRRKEIDIWIDKNIAGKTKNNNMKQGRH